MTVLTPLDWICHVCYREEWELVRGIGRGELPPPAPSDAQASFLDELTEASRKLLTKLGEQRCLIFAARTFCLSKIMAVWSLLLTLMANYRLKLGQ